MFFLLPLLPILTTAAATISTAEIAAGTAAAMGIGMTAKSLLDRKQTAAIRTEAETEYQRALSAEQISVKGIKHKLIEFGKIKRAMYDIVLQKAIHTVSACKDDAAADSLQGEITLFKEHYAKSRKRCSMQRQRLLRESKSSYEDIQKQFDLHMGAFGLYNSVRPAAASLYDTVLHFIVGGMENRHRAERFAWAVKTENAEIHKRAALYKKLLQRLDEGIAVIRHLSQKLTILCNRLDTEQKSAQTLSLSEKTLLIRDSIAIGNTLLRIIEIDICSVEGKLLKEAGLIYTTTGKEFQHV
ncbi:hypothetical protein H0R94_06630 [Treponema socranskii]|jgi:hypothetical protein|uniref:hypothetical protein n=1 Tax=Treponema socranskii TaxID=53419 RepID=UPI003D8A892A